jgi:hypothetical protein
MIIYKDLLQLKELTSEKLLLDSKECNIILVEFIFLLFIEPGQLTSELNRTYCNWNEVYQEYSSPTEHLRLK